MRVSLYDATVLAFIQTVGAVQGFMGRTLKHCTQTGMDANQLLEARVIADMLPLSFQLRSVVKNSVTAIEDAKNGAFSMPAGEPPKLDFTGYQDVLTEAGKKLAGYTREEVNALEGRPVAFKTPVSSVTFTAEGYLLSFSLPNFYFHSTTAYDILRMNGIPLGKRDFLGTLRFQK